MNTLTEQQVKQYNKDGYISPIDALTKEEVTTVRKEIEFIEKQMPNEIDKSGRYNVHLISPKLDAIVHNSKILDAVEDLIGRDILAAGTTLFIRCWKKIWRKDIHPRSTSTGANPAVKLLGLCTYQGSQGSSKESLFDKIPNFFSVELLACVVSR